MTPLSSKLKLKMSLAGVVCMLGITQMPKSPFDDSPTDWRLWAVCFGLLLGATTRSAAKVFYQWNYQRDRKKTKVRSR